MKVQGTIFAGAMALLLTLAARPAIADCLEGNRTTSPAEKAAHKKVGAVLGKAFHAPEGWKNSGEKPHRVPGSVCKNSTGERLNATYKVSFMEMDGAKKRQEKMKAEMMTLAAGGPGDRDAMQAKMEAIQKMTQELQRDTIIEVEVKLNQELVLDPGLPITVPGGYRAFQAPQPGEIPGQRRTTVLMGEWTKDEEGHWRAPRKKGLPVQAIQTATVQVKAGEERTQSFLASSNLKSIAALLDAPAKAGK